MTPFQSLFAQPGDLYMPYPKNAPRLDDLMSMPPQEIADLPVELLAILQREIDEREATLTEIGAEQSRIRENMAQLDRTSDLYKRYVEKFTEQEDEYEQLQGEITDLQEKVNQQTDAIRAYILGLDME